MSGTLYRTLLVAGGLILSLLLLYWSGYFNVQDSVITDDLAQFDAVGERVKEDFAEYPLVALNDEYTLTDTLKDGVEITYGNQASTTFHSPDLAESLSLTFPKTLGEPMNITLPGNRTFTVTHEVEEEYARKLLVNETPATDPFFAGEFSQELSKTIGPSDEESVAGEFTAQPQYLKYTSSDNRVHTYYAYQKDQAAGYRNLKHWTIFNDGDGQETQSYVFSNAHLRTNDRGEVEVRYLPTNTAPEPGVSEDLWARAQRTLAADMLADIEHTAPDLTIPAPYTIDAQGNQVTHEWVVTKASAINPSDTSGNYILSVSFSVPLLGYPIALDPTLQFTAPGVSNSGDYIDGESSSKFGVSLATGDFNADGKDDLVVGAQGYNSYQGRVYIFWSASRPDNAAEADVVLTGETTSDYFGFALSTGDFDADGRDDLVVSGYGYDVGSNTNEGRAYVFYGDNLSDKNASEADVIFTGVASPEYFGYSFATGDFNADGTDDLAVGAQRYSTFHGRAYIFYGGSMVSETASGADVTLTGGANYDYFGDVLAVGDFNADGTDDLAVGAFGYTSFSFKGRAYVFYGGSMISESAGGADVTLTGEANSNQFGSTLDAGDFNHDGKDDLVVGAPSYNTGQGRVYIFNGGSIVTEVASGADTIITGETSSNLGYAFSVADFNADGTDDLAVGGRTYDVGSATNEGRTYLFYGGSMTSSSDASAANVILTGEAGGYFGSSLTSGDFNSDGKEDLVVGADSYNSDQGRAYIFYSQSGQVNLDQHITGEGTGDYFGSAFAVGDFNADGRDDLAVGAYQDNSNTGKVYIFYNDGDYPSLASTSDVVIAGTSTTGDFGKFLAAGDMDADGDDDLIVGAPGESSDTGYIAIFYNDGSYPSSSADADVSIVGEGTNDDFGIAFTIGDFNSDGTADIAVGASSYSTSQGRVYIFHNDGSYPASAVSADVTIAGESSSLFGIVLATGDMDSDGDDDLIVGGRLYSSFLGRVYIFYNDGSYPNASGADEKITGSVSFASFGKALAVSDLDADGDDDLVVGGANSYIFYNDGSYPASDTGADVTIDDGGSAYAVGDFNNDGRQDLASGSYLFDSYTGAAYVYYNDGLYPTSSSSADIIIKGDSANDDFGWTLATGDFNHDGKDDLVVGAPGYDNGGDTGRIYFNETREDYAWEIQRSPLSDGVRVDPLMGYEMKITGEASTGGVGAFGRGTAVGDINGDGKEDLLVTAANKVYVFYNDGNYPTKAGRADVNIVGEGTYDSFGDSLVVGDFNADGIDDFAVGAEYVNFSSSGKVYIFYGGSTLPKNAADADEIITGNLSHEYLGNALAVGDLNNDGKDDLIVGGYKITSGYSYVGRITVYYNDGTYPSSADDADISIKGNAGSQNFGTIVAVGDMDNDNDDDLVVYDADYDVTIYYNDGSWPADKTSADETISGGYSVSLLVTDIDGDQDDDLFVGELTNAYGYYNDGSYPASNVSADVVIAGEAANNYISSITEGDFDNDGDIDIVFGSSGYDVGSNTNEGRVYIFTSDISSGTTTAVSADIVLTGESVSNGYGGRLATGDLNNDGTDDLVIGGVGYNSGQGRVYFYTTNDWQVTGETSGEKLGSSFAIGDYNNDGKNDLAVGATGYNSNQGRVYVFYGGRKSTTSVSGADITLTGEGGLFGSSLATGDLNADGKDDLAVGAYAYNSSQGRTYVFYGGSMTSENASGADVTLTGEGVADFFGISLATGDLNADGKDDLVVGAYGYTSYNDQGRAYIFYGGSMVSENASGADVTLTGEASGDYFGNTLTIGDFNSDGTADLVVSANGYDAYSFQGRAYIFYGGSMVSENASGADVTLTGEASSDYFGDSLATADLNVDGKDDLVVGARNPFSSSPGKVFVFYGGSMAPKNATGADVTITGEGGTDYFGSSLATGDLNADGKDDLVVGASNYNSSQGRTYIFYNDGRYAEDAQYADVIVTGEEGSDIFSGTVFSGDLSGNGVDDIVISANEYDVSSNEGRVYIIMSEAATQYRSGYKFRGDVKLRGTVKFH